ncbi:hypothetical protein K1516_00220 [Stenotrophomonas maltophilia]|uniref:hypothetical protein n=1 Tax=Stenotrophomonas maltophilia TaxID=40324 RepID=UPI00200D29F8|nr:hypothetical protein [Stenotrophomonas maltophilia]UQA70610.1 hypothetical protein K1516_00220 [Stenotrophomonas maltophilia]
MDDRIDEELFAEWLEFCAGRSEQEDWYFSGLLQGVTDPNTLAAIFARFPHADALQSRALDVLGAGRWGEHLYLQPAIAGDAQAVAAAARTWLDELARVAGRAGEPGLQATLRDVPVVAATTGQLQAAWRESGPAAYLHDVVCDVVRAARTLDTPQVAALDEALYHIASDLYLGWYIAQPLSPAAVDFASYLAFWRLGGRGALVEGAFLVEAAGLVP